MDQTRFDVLQSAFQVLNELFLPNAVWVLKGDSFALTLLAELDSGETAPLDIYLLRIPEDKRPTARRPAEPDGTRSYRAQGRIDPDGELFDVNVYVERAPDMKEKRPFVRVSPDFHRLLKERQERRLDAALDTLLGEPPVE